MKFITYLEKVSGVDIYGMISLLMFVLFFGIIITWVFKTRRNKFTEISRIPLDN